MIDRYAQAFSRLTATGRKAFIPFTLLGYPDAETSYEIVKTMIDNGVTALELGLPFSDPIADGPTIAQAAFQTLSQGFKAKDALELLERIRALDAQIPIGLLVYYNMILAAGIERFFSRVAFAGVDAVLVADLPIELSDELYDAACHHGIKLIFIVSPLTESDRLIQIVRRAGGFIYLVSRLGVTGVQEKYDSALASTIALIREHTVLPICVGFGISTPEQARQILALGCDGVITGSRLIELISANKDKAPRQYLAPFLRQFVQQLSSC